MIGDLIKRLENEVGLSEEQAIKTISIIKEQMDKEGLEIDWEKFFKGKTEDFLEKAKSLFSSVSKQTQSYTDKLVDKVDEFADKARKGARDLGQKANDLFDEK